MKRRWIVTIESSDELLDGQQLDMIVTKALPGAGRVIGVATDNWIEKTDSTHACPICFDSHFPRRTTDTQLSNQKQESR